MSSRRTFSWGQIARLAVCGLLMAWIFHVIFCNEAQTYLTATGAADRWTALSKWEQRKLAWRVGPEELWGRVSGMDRWWLASAIAQCGAFIVVGGWRWRYVMRVQGLDLPLRQATRISFIAHFFNAFLLGSTGGDVLKAWYAARLTHHKKTEAVISVFADRLLGLLALLVWAAIMMPGHLEIIRAHRSYLACVAIILGMLFVASVAVFVGLYTDWLGNHSWMAHQLRRLPRGESMIQALVACRVLGKKPEFPWIFAALSLICNLLTVGSIWALARGLHLEIPWTILAFVGPMVVCISALPITPSGLGVREHLLVALLTIPVLASAPYGIKHTDALSLSLLIYLSNVFWCLVGGIIYLVWPERKISSEELP